jgi:CRISPR-associated protein Cmr6
MEVTLQMAEQPIPARRKALGRCELTRAAHPGLVLHRYLEHAGSPEARQDLLKVAIASCHRAQRPYAAALKRFEESLPDAVKRPVMVDGRLITGLGSASVLEAGIALHHTYGVPVIRGTSLKGLASHYCTEVWGLRDQEFRAQVDCTREDGSRRMRPGLYHDVLFGTTRGAGHAVFHDAWIDPASLADTLQADVITVHHPEYYKGGSQAAPTDFDDPNPVSFLSVRGTFHLYVSWDTGGPETEKWKRLAMTLLLEALEHWGVGGKTNSGYGRMLPVRLTPVAAPHPPKEASDLRPGERVRARRVEDPRPKPGRDRLWFEEVNGRGSGTISAGPPPSTPEMGAEVELVVKSVADSVNFKWPDDRSAKRN